MMWYKIIKNAVLIVLVLNAVQACSGNRLSVIDQEYENSKKIFPEELISHFPENIGENYITHTEIVSPEAGIVRLDLTVKFDPADKIKELLDSAVAVYRSEDTCLLVANRFAKREKYGFVDPEDVDTAKISRFCYEDKYPVPDFWQSDHYSDSTECKLKKGFLLYVLDSKPGIYMPAKYLSSDPYLPEKWKHGYSKGIAVNYNDRILIYWVIVW